MKQTKSKLRKIDEVLYGILGVSFFISLIILSWTTNWIIILSFTILQILIWGIHGMILEKITK